MSICDRYDERVRGPPIGAEDEKGFDVGYQALGNLRSGGRVTAYQQQNLLPLNLNTAAAQLWKLLLGEKATPLSAKNNEYAPIGVNVASCCG